MQSHVRVLNQRRNSSVAAKTVPEKKQELKRSVHRDTERNSQKAAILNKI